MSAGWGQSDDITFSEFDSKGNPINYNPDIINERDLGDFLSSCPIPPYQHAVIDWYEGFLWIAYDNEGYNYGDSQQWPYLYKMDVSTCEILDTINFFPPEIVAVCDIEWVEDYLWVADCGGDPDKIYKLDNEGNIITSFPSPDDGPVGLAWDGEYLWDISWETNKIHKIDPTSGEIIYEVDSYYSHPMGLEWDNGALWSIGRNDVVTYKINPYSFEIITVFGNQLGPWMNGLAFDGQYLWENYAYAGDFVYQIDIEYEGSGAGCTDPSACNYDESATEDDGSCEYEVDECGICGGDNSTCYDCAGIPNGDNELDNCDICDDNPDNDCVQDCSGEWGGSAELDECGVCNGDNSSCSGCTDPNASNYDENATIDDGTCEYDEVYGCTYLEATNYNPDATDDDGSCEYLWGDMNYDGTLNILDILTLANNVLSGLFP